MWNFLVSGLSVGCTLVLYDGSPLYDPPYLWRLVDELAITIFGTSAKYIDQLTVCIHMLFTHPSNPTSPSLSFLVHCACSYRKSTNRLSTTNCQLCGIYTPQARHWLLISLTSFTSTLAPMSC